MKTNLTVKEILAICLAENFLEDAIKSSCIKTKYGDDSLKTLKSLTKRLTKLIRKKDLNAYEEPR